VTEANTCKGTSIASLPTRNYQPASICTADFAAAARKLGVKPRSYVLKAGPGKYKLVALQLPSGRHATLTQWAQFPETIDIGLELVRDDHFFEQDLLAILELLGVASKDASRQGAFKWK
jgi:hypothetical protein